MLQNDHLLSINKYVRGHTYAFQAAISLVIRNNNAYYYLRFRQSNAVMGLINATRSILLNAEPKAAWREAVLHKTAKPFKLNKENMSKGVKSRGISQTSFGLFKIFYIHPELFQLIKKLV